MLRGVSWRLALVLCTAVIVAAAPAFAARAPTAAEARAIRLTVNAFVRMGNSPAARDNRVVRIRVSSVDRHYALVNLDSRSAGPSLAVLRLRTRWRVIGFGSSPACSVVPRRIRVDLKIPCSP
jgi:hypothetical protein